MATPDSSQKILITGGAGFLGSHLCSRLLLDGHQVICLDNFHTGRRDNIVSMMEHDRFSLIEHNVCSPISLEMDCIYNMACPASPIKYQTDPLMTTKTAVLGSLNLLELADRCGARILQASTSEVYGDPTVHPQPETYWGNVNPIGMRSCYDEGKRCAETLFSDFHRHNGTEIKIARIFNTYGPKMAPDDGRVVSTFIMQALQDEDITIFGDGTQTRSFCFVDDLIDGLVRLMESPSDITGPINIGNPQDITMLELAERILSLTGSNSNLAHSPLPPQDPSRRKPDISLAVKHLDWRPSVSLDLGLQRTIAYFSELLYLTKYFDGATAAKQASHD